MKQSNIVWAIALAALVTQPAFSKSADEGPRSSNQYKNHPYKNLTPEERLAKRQHIQEKWDALSESEQQTFIKEARERLEERHASRQEHRLIMMYSFYLKNPKMFDQGKDNKHRGSHQGNHMKKERAHKGADGQKDRQAMKDRFEQAKQQWDALSKEEQEAFKQKIEARKSNMEERRAQSMAKRLFAETLNQE